MKRIVFASMLVIMAFFSHAQVEQPTESKITEVTVFLNKAQITREVKTRINAGNTLLVVRGLTSSLDQQSIQVSGKGKIIIEGISHRQNFLSELNMPSKLRTLKDSVEMLQRQVLLEQSQKEILNKEEQMIMSNQKVGGTQTNLTVVELKAMADFFRTRLSDIVTSRMKQDEKIKKLNAQVVKLQSQVSEQNELYRRNTSEIVISISAEAATAVDLAIKYVVPNAGWQPVYDLRATNTKSPVQLNYKANVFQGTGEEWKNVKLTLSTANPNEGGLKPELHTWSLDFYQPIAHYSRERSMGEMKKAEMSSPMMAGQREAEEVATSADYTNTIQTSLNTEFAIGLPYTVSSSNTPTMVDIRSHELKAVYAYSVAPKLDKDAFLVAKAVGWEEFSLLPGEANIFFEGTFVSTTFIDPNNIKDTLALSLGRDKRVVVKREKMKDFTSRKLIGSNQRDSYAFEITLRNTKTEAIRISIEDQIPISRNNQIEVTTLDTGGARYIKETGKLVWEITLQPNEDKKVQFKYEVKYPKDKQVSGLE